MAVPAYPVRVEATLDGQLSRWLWLVKWLLAIPHYVILAFLWLAFVFTSVVAFFAIAVTGRYPPALFDFNVGVLRWSWRVHYYSFGALATDQYPPFTLAEVPNYPAHLEIAFPERLSRGLVWVKWWLLAIPHYIIVGIFVGGGTWAAWHDHTAAGWAPGGLLGILVLIAAVILLFTGRYPRQVFDLILGVDRWVLRVAAYSALMTDQYPPFRLDQGGHEPGGTLTVPPSAQPVPPVGPEAFPTGPPSPGGWTGWRIASLVVGSLLALVSLGLFAAGGVATWADNTQRDSSGFITSGTHDFTTGSFALTSGTINLGSSADAVTPSDFLGTVRVRVTPVDPRSNLFIGLAPATAANRYLAGMTHEEVTDWASGTTTYRTYSGGTPSVLPQSAGFWTVRTAGPGEQTMAWKPGHGDWRIVVMNTDGRPGLSVKADVGATMPDLGWIAAGLLIAGGLALAGSAALVVIPIVRASR